MHLDEKTPHLHIDYVPVAGGYKSGMKIRNSQSVALQQMGFGKNKNSINSWRMQERKVLRGICEKYGLEISEETLGRGKNYTPDEYKKMRDETKEEFRSDENLMNEVRGDYISKNKATLVDEVERQAEEEISVIKNAFAEEIRQIEGRIAFEKRINAMADGIKENTLFGKTNVTIKFDGTAEEAMTVFKAAKDRDNARKAKDKTIADKNKAIKEKDEAVNARELAEKQKNVAEKKAYTAKSVAAAELEKANTIKSEAASEMRKAQDLYSQQTNLNSLYLQAVSDRDAYKAIADKATALEVALKCSYSTIGSMAKAISALLYYPVLTIGTLTPPQERLLKAISNYAVAWAKKDGFMEIAEDIEKHYEISSGIQKHIDELTPKRRRSHDYGR